MTNDFKIIKATRRGVIPLIGLYAESGCGKTMSALLLARGLVGPTGDIHMIDTESRRGSLYADVIPGGYSVCDLEPPFTPTRYVAAMQAVISAGAKIIVIDSMSHEWEGMGGVLDAAAENEARAEEKAREKGWEYKPGGLNVWKKPKMEHAKMVQFLLRSPVPVVCCVRSKYKTRQTKDEKGKAVIVKDKFTSPIQADDFIFEMTAHAEVLPDHSINLTKCSHPALRECFPKQGPIAAQHGELIAKWCAAGGQPAAPSNPMEAELKAVKTKIWNMTKGNHDGKSWTSLEAWLQGLGYIGDTMRIADMDLDGLNELFTTLSTAAAKTK